MANYPWYFQETWNIFRKNGFTYLIRKSVRYLYLNFLRISGNQWWNSYKDLDDAQEKILKFAEARSRGEYGAGEAFLQEAFVHNLQTGYQLPKDYISIFLDSVEKRQVLHDFSDCAKEPLITATRGMIPGCLPLCRWFVLQYICQRNGFFKTAFIVRQKAIEKAYLDSGNYFPGSLDMAFRAAVDQAEFEKARIFLDKVRGRVPALLLEERESYHNLNTGKLRLFQESKEKKFDSYDREFSRYIEGKSVAIVGPSPSGDARGEEIDSFDVVVRFNHRGGEDTVSGAGEAGSRTDISYYNTFHSNRIGESGTAHIPMDYAIFRNIKHNYQKKLLESGKGRTLRYNGLFFNGKPFMANSALYDILQFHPAQVKLFNINFYLSKIPYETQYSTTGLTEYFIYSFISFARHDIMSNFNFTRNLWNAGLIEADRVCERVVSLPTDAYMRAMEDLFAPESGRADWAGNQDPPGSHWSY